jgi:hypothetical protein
MKEIEEIQEELTRFSDSIDNAADKLDRLSVLFEHYMYNVHGVRAPDAKKNMRPVQKTTEH